MPPPPPPPASSKIHFISGHGSVVESCAPSSSSSSSSSSLPCPGPIPVVSTLKLDDNVAVVMSCFNRFVVTKSSEVAQLRTWIQKRLPNFTFHSTDSPSEVSIVLNNIRRAVVRRLSTLADTDFCIYTHKVPDIEFSTRKQAPANSHFFAHELQRDDMYGDNDDDRPITEMKLSNYLQTLKLDREYSDTFTS